MEGRKQATHKGGGFWVKTQKPSRGGSVFANTMRGALDPGSGVHIRAVQRQFKDVGGRNRAMREGVNFGSKPRNRAMGAWFSQKTCGGLRIQVVECMFGWCNASLRRWGAAIGRRAREAVFGTKYRKRAAKAQFSRTTCWGVLYLGKGNLPEVARYGCRGVDTVIKPACRVGWVLLT